MEQCSDEKHNTGKMHQQQGSPADGHTLLRLHPPVGLPFTSGLQGCDIGFDWLAAWSADCARCWTGVFIVWWATWLVLWVGLAAPSTYSIRCWKFVGSWDHSSGRRVEKLHEAAKVRIVDIASVMICFPFSYHVFYWGYFLVHICDWNMLKFG